MSLFDTRRLTLFPHKSRHIPVSLHTSIRAAQSDKPHLYSAFPPATNHETTTSLIKRECKNENRVQLIGRDVQNRSKGEKNKG